MFKLHMYTTKTEHVHSLSAKKLNVACRSCKCSLFTANEHINLANPIIGTWISFDDSSDRPFVSICRFLSEKHNITLLKILGLLFPRRTNL